MREAVLAAMAALSTKTAGCGGALCGANQTGTNPNAGVLVLRPSAANFAAVERAARAMRACPKYPEQGVLETAFAGRLRWVSRWWNSRERGAKVGSEHATPFAHGVAHARAQYQRRLQRGMAQQHGRI